MATWTKIITKDNAPDTLKVPIVMQWSMEYHLGAQTNQTGNDRRRWMMFNRRYGPNYHNWDNYSYGTNTPTAFYDTYNQGIKIPFDCEIRSFSVYGNLALSATAGLDGGTALFELKTNRDAMTHDGSSQNIVLLRVGDQKSFTMSENNISGVKEEDFTITGSLTNGSLSEGDILVPYLCRDFNLDNSIVRKFEGVFTIVLWKDIEIG